MESSCYGEYWDLQEAACQTCPGKDECLAKFATGALLKFQKQLGEEASSEKLSALTSVSVEAVQAALAFQKNTGITIKPILVESEPVVSAPVKPPEQVEPISKVEPPEIVIQDQFIVQDEATKVEAAEPEPVRKKRGRKPKIKSVPVEETKAVEAVNPPEAETTFVQSALVSAETMMIPSVSVALAQANPKTWDPKYNKDRHDRERKRSPEIAKLVPGTVIKRTWKGVETTTTVRQGYYQYNGNRYPTLYTVMVAITGLTPVAKQLRNGKRPEGKRYMTAWSAVRFFQIKELVKDK